MAARRSAIMTSAREHAGREERRPTSACGNCPTVSGWPSPTCCATSTAAKRSSSRSSTRSSRPGWPTSTRRLGKPRARKADYANEIRRGDDDRRLAGGRGNCCASCSASMAGVLERNISGDFARDFKARAMANVAAVGATRRAATAVAAPRIHRVLRRGRADPDRRHVSVLGTHRAGPRRRWPRWAFPSRSSGSATACAPG